MLARRISSIQMNINWEELADSNALGECKVASEVNSYASRLPL